MIGILPITVLIYRLKCGNLLKIKAFLALIIPKGYGGKEFSAYAHSQILIKVAGVSLWLDTAVPNSWACRIIIALWN